MSDIQAWINKLDAMTADDIADLLKAEGVTGRRVWVEACPLANFLRTKGDVAYLFVGGAIVHWADNDPASPGRHVRSHGGIRDFVTRFDYGQYPDLLAGQDTPENATSDLCPV